LSTSNDGNDAETFTYNRKILPHQLILLGSRGERLPVLSKLLRVTGVDIHSNGCTAHRLRYSLPIWPGAHEMNTSIFGAITIQIFVPLQS